MKLAAALGALASLALCATAGASGVTAPKTIGTSGEVVSISADGGNVAIHAATKADSPCDSAAVWTPASGQIVRFVDASCTKGPDARFYALTLAGTRAAWGDYDYGNNAYCEGSMTATLAAPKAGDLGICSGDPNGYVEYAGDGSLLVARTYLDCADSCGPDYSGTYEDAITLYTIGTSAKKLGAEPRNTWLLDVDAGRILIRDGKTKKLVVLDAAGKPVGGVPLDAGIARLDGAGRVSVASGTNLQTYDVGTGKVVETCTMKKGAHLWDVENGTAVYSVGNELHLLTIASNRDRTLVTANKLVSVDLEPGGVFYAYNVPKGGAKPGRVAFLRV